MTVGGYPWGNTVDGGGEMWSTGGSYDLGGTIGQPDAGQMSGGLYTLEGGFLAIAPTPPPTADQIIDGLLGRDSATSNMDLNGDGVVDIADLLFLLNP